MEEQLKHLKQNSRESCSGEEVWNIFERTKYFCKICHTHTHTHVHELRLNSNLRNLNSEMFVLIFFFLSFLKMKSIFFVTFILGDDAERKAFTELAQIPPRDKEVESY